MLGILLLSSYVSASGRWRSFGEFSDPQTLLDVTIAVRQNPISLKQLEDTFWQVSDPSSSRYTQYLSQQDVTSLTSPRVESVTAVTQWIRNHIPSAHLSFSPARDFIHTKVTVSQVEALLPGAKYLKFQRDGLQINRVYNYTLPSYISSHVDFVAPTNQFPAKMSSHLQKPRKADEAISPKLKVDPPSIRELYKIGSVQATSGKISQQAAGFLNNSMNPDDLQTFFKQYYTDGTGRTATIVGPNNPSNPTIEGSLDIQYLMSLGANVSTTYWYTAGERPYPGGGENEPFLTWLTDLTGSNGTLPDVISVSYADEEFVIDPAFADRVDTEFLKLGVRGSTLLFGSGDDGVTGDHGVCPHGQFVPWWPASSPYVTAVGATESMDPSHAAGFSGGGFSNRYGRPSYQDAAVKQYVSTEGVPPNKYYNQTGAGFPDVSAVGVGFWTIVGGLPTEVGGTSASTPTFAGIVSLLNDARANQGKAPLGNLNKLLYAHPEMFTDITSGTNTGGGGCGYGGFPAEKGWDPISGLGTPLFPNMLSVVTSLP